MTNFIVSCFIIISCHFETFSTDICLCIGRTTGAGSTRKRDRTEGNVPVEWSKGKKRKKRNETTAHRLNNGKMPRFCK